MHEIIDNRVVTDPPKKPKKITGTRFAAILGLDPWNTPFKTWCAITKVYQEPFTGNKYTEAGKVIEPKITEYLNKVYFDGEIITPEDVYGENPYKKTWGDFFPKNPVMGGMWDAKTKDAVIEIKTTKRAEDWSDGPPENYALQAALYARLMELDQVYMVVAFLEDNDYENPQDFVPNASNTTVVDFLVSEKYPHMGRHIDRAIDWWQRYVLTGESPEFDETKDADILKELRTNRLTDQEIEDVIEEAERLQVILDISKSTLKAKEDRLKELKDQIKEYAIGEMGEYDRVSVDGPSFQWTLSKSTKVTVNTKALERDGLLPQYSKESISYTLRTKSKEDK